MNAVFIEFMKPAIISVRVPLFAIFSIILVINLMVGLPWIDSIASLIYSLVNILFTSRIVSEYAPKYSMSFRYDIKASVPSISRMRRLFSNLARVEAPFTELLNALFPDSKSNGSTVTPSLYILPA